MPGCSRGSGNEVCYTTRDFVSDQGQAVLAVAVYDMKGPQDVVLQARGLGEAAVREADGVAAGGRLAVVDGEADADWTKVCGKDQGSGNEVCYTTRDFVSDQGQAVLAVAFRPGASAKQPFGKQTA
jgi:invasion protein IalB